VRKVLHHAGVLLLLVLFTAFCVWFDRFWFWGVPNWVHP
jgi:hypothetical protein